MASLSNNILSGLGPIIEQMDAIRAQVGDLFPLNLPRIIVLGQECTGKSSVLERLCFFSCFPRDQRITTRMPTHLNLKHCSVDELQGLARQAGVAFDPSLIVIRLRHQDVTTGEITESPFYSVDEIEARVLQFMTQAVAADGGEVTRNRLYVEATGVVLPDLRLVDLPGIFATDDTGSGAAQRTKELALEYLRQDHTLALVVVPATETRVRNSQACKLVVDEGKQDVCLGVLTMVDMVHTQRLESHVIHRLQGHADDMITLGHGYVAVKNRSSDTGESLEEAANRELPWFNEYLPDLADTGRVGSDQLVAHLSSMLQRHVREVWIVDTLRRLPLEIARVRGELEQLGFDPEERAAQEVFGLLMQRAAELMSTKATRPSVTAPAQSLVQSLAPLRAAQTLLVSPRVRGSRTDALGVIDGKDELLATGAAELARAVARESAALLAADNEPGTTRLVRFARFREWFERALVGQIEPSVMATAERLFNSHQAVLDSGVQVNSQRLEDAWTEALHCAGFVRGLMALRDPQFVASAAAVFGEDLRAMCAEDEETQAMRARLTAAVGTLHGAVERVEKLRAAMDAEAVAGAAGAAAVPRPAYVAKPA